MIHAAMFFPDVNGAGYADVQQEIKDLVFPEA